MPGFITRLGPGPETRRDGDDDAGGDGLLACQPAGRWLAGWLDDASWRLMMVDDAYRR